MFGDRDSGFYLRKFAWTRIERHRMVPGMASPDDPTLADYWSRRRRRRQPLADPSTKRLLKAQNGRCPRCRSLLLAADQEPQSPHEWERWFKVLRLALRKQAITTGKPNTDAALHLIHRHCQQRDQPEVDSGPAEASARP